MFSSRNIHFAILGIILGGTSGYILAFYQVQSAMPRSPASSSGVQSGSKAPQGHPEVTNDQLLAMFKEALDKSPNNPTLMTRYANFLFDLGRFPEAVEWFRKVLALQPDNLDARTDLGTALWSAGEKDQAMAEYQTALKIDPKRVATLHNIAMAQLEKKDYPAAERSLKQIEEVDPKYAGLEGLKKRLADETGKTAK